MKYLIALAAVLISFGAFSCDVCGGVSAPGTQGLLSSNKFHFIGIKSSYNQFRSIHGAHFIQDQTSTEHFFRSSLVGKWQLADRLNIQLELPYTYNLQENPSGTRSEYGIGDINLVSNYLLVNQKTAEGMTKHALRIGAGLKMPTGRYANDVWSTSNLHPGTGAIDAIITTNYVYRKTRVGILQENSLILKGKNKYEYRYGSAFFTRSAIFYNRPISETTILLPSAGLNYLYTATDRIQGSEVSQLFNSGHLLNAELSINLLTTQWMFNLKGSFPVFQYLGNGFVSSKGNLELSILYLIQKK